MSSRARLVGVVLLAQAGLLGAFWMVERSREQDGHESLSTDPPQQISGVVPAISLLARDGTSRSPTFDRTTILHVWATWCPPCRVELPSLLAVPAAHPVEVIAVALDAHWDTVDRFIRWPTELQFLGDRDELPRVLGVRTLPATFVIGRGGRLRYRFDGARDWSDDAFVRRWLLEDEAE